MCDSFNPRVKICFITTKKVLRWSHFLKIVQHVFKLINLLYYCVLVIIMCLSSCVLCEINNFVKNIKLHFTHWYPNGEDCDSHFVIQNHYEI